MRNGVIYLVTNKINNKKYIGRSVNFKERFNNHFSTTYNIKSANYNTVFHRAIRKYGEINFEWEILCECPEDDLNIQEKYWIKYFRTFISSKEYDGSNGYNMTEGGEGTKGRVFSDETIKKFSETRKGVKLTEEHKNNIKIGVTGEKNPFYGKIHSEETKNKISINHKDKKIYTFFNKATMEYFNGTRYDFYTKYNLSMSAVASLLNGKIKVLKKVWIYLKEY